MKKLMTTLFAAAAAFGLRAADPGAVSGTSFEGQPAGDYIITDGTGELFGLDEGQTYWVTNDTATLTVVNGTSAEGQFPGTGINRRPLAFENDYQNQYLKIKTTLGNPVTRNVGTNGLGIAIKKDGEGAYDGLYFDSLVKFTAFDSNPEIILGNDGKLAIWLEEKLNDNDVPTKTNLVITAGYLDGSQTRVVATNYVCDVDGVNFNDGGWHRVTVKALDSIYKTGDAYPGFVVFVDGHYAMCEEGKGITGTLTDAAKSWNDVDALFPSAVQLGGSKQTIASVSFDGQGEVDDLVFTTKAPSFAKDDEYFTITLDSNIASVTYQVDGEEDEVEITETTPITYTPGMKVTIVDVQGKTGYMLDEVAYDSGVETNWVDDVLWYEPSGPEQGISVGSKVSGAYIVGGDKYETLEAAFLAVSGMSGSQEIKMTGNYEGSVNLNTETLSDVTLDLRGFSITGADSSAAIYVYNNSEGSLLLTITNSTVEVGSVVAGENGSALMTVYADVAIGGGIFDGLVNVAGAESYKITGGAFLYTPNAANETILDAAVKSALGGQYGIVHDGDYYVVGAAGVTKYLVDIYDGAVLVATTNIEENTTLVQPADPAERTGYTFAGWCTDPSDPTTAWNFATGVTADMTLYAGWTINSYTVTFVVDGASSTITKDYNTTIAAAEVPETQARTGYTGAWDTNPEGQTVTGDITYTYTYTADNYTITYMYGENELSGLTPATYTITNAVTLPSEVDLGVAGVSFEAWTNAEGQVVANWAAGATGNKTFYAQVTVPGPAEKYEPGEEGITPPTGKTAAEFAAVINADKAKYIDTPSTADVADTAAYLALFQAVADTEKGTVSIGLTTAAAETEQIAANETAADIVSDLTATEVEIDAQPGLWYSISVSSTLGGLAAGEGTRVMATDSNVAEGKLTLDIPVIDDSTPARFYKVNVNLADKPSQD